ncbi:TOX high mobility group box family member 2 isoform X1 [Phlebotomus argentipes]|uniref:TOX high mobility group box family member 2 isoform X1 n=2 Tax=Phlebotomus argentipes TaxID=94469 RepID=UPI002892D76D|nr:TOX high mobility group box family member 2 isoform X1 [Phlebotomus argentipes]
MEAYNTGSDLNVNRMFDQYLYKRNDESIDVALSVPQYNGHHQHSTQHFDMNDQTFHTPSFGDEDFDIPPMTPHMAQQQHPPQQAQQHQYQMHSTPPHHMAMMGDHYSHQWHADQPPQHMGHHNTSYSMQPQGQPNYPLTSPTHHQTPQPTHQMLMMQPPQQSPQMAPQMSPQIGGAGGAFIGRSPPQGVHGQTETGTTSDDSDDNGIPINSLKRPSPEPLMSDSANSPNGNGNLQGAKGASSSASKKPKVQKKKKKRDPNEPQKPVSAYALFFRDTQAAIKGQNPNASFGEVSKIVASMWDVLATEHKNVYKKKTEAAKKEYLKALAAYRASLVSKGSDSEQGQYSSPPHQQGQQGPGGGVVTQQSPQHQQQGGALMGAGPPSMAPQTSPHLPRPQQPQPPPQQQSQPQQPPPANQAPSPHYPPYSSPYKSPPQHQQVMMQQSLQMQHHNPHLPHQQQQSMMNQMNSMGSMMGQMNPPPQQQATHVNPMNHPAMNGAMMGMGGMPQYMNQQMHPAQQPPHGHQMVGPPGGGGGGQISPHTMSPVSGTPPSNEHHPNQCIRHGCTNQAIVNQDWEDEYCSNECVITHCRDVFGNWVQTNAQQPQTYSAVK